MKNALTVSESRFKEILLKAGFSESEIKVPDADITIEGTADFLIGDVVFEVKEVNPTKLQMEELEKIKSTLKKNGSVTNLVHDARKQFKDDIDDARRKFQAYSSFSTVLVEDLSSWGWFWPDIESMMFGDENLHIAKDSGDIVGRSWSGRLLQIQKNRTIGSYMFISEGDILLYHNLMAYENKMMPLEFMNHFQKVVSEQYIFVNIPGRSPLIRTIM